MSCGPRRGCRDTIRTPTTTNNNNKYRVLILKWPAGTYVRTYMYICSGVVKWPKVPSQHCSSQNVTQQQNAECRMTCMSCVHHYNVKKKKRYAQLVRCCFFFLFFFCVLYLCLCLYLSSPVCMYVCMRTDMQGWLARIIFPPL